MKIRMVALVFAIASGLAACGHEAPAPASQAVATGLQPWNLPAPPGSGEPDLVATPRGRLVLTWLNTEQGRRSLLQYAELGVDGRWQGPLSIAVGKSFVANAVDTPHIAIADRGSGINAENNKASFGSRLIQAMVQQLDGKLALEDNRPGLRAVLTIAAAEPV